MPSKTNIQKLVDEITQPNAVCVINNEVPENEEDRFLHILYSLITLIKGCISKEVYHPYIHIKDVYGNFLFNDRLHIHEWKVNQIAIGNSGYCDIHLIKKKGSKAVYYYAATPDTLADNNRFYLSHINFSNGEINEIAYQIAATSILKMVKEGEGIDKNTPIDTSVTVHNYDPNSKFWMIEYFARDVSGSKF